MNALVINIPRNTHAKKYHVLITKAAEFYIKALFRNKDFNGNINITILVKVGHKKKIGHGEISVVPIEHKRQNVTDFDLMLRNTHINAMLRTLAHECTHIMQFCTKKLAYIQKGNNTYVCWDKQDIPFFTLETLNETKKLYRKLPWEIEAGASEKKLYKMFSHYALQMLKQFLTKKQYVRASRKRFVALNELFNKRN